MKPTERTKKLAVTFECECGGRCAYDPKEQALVHTLPYCVDFRDLAPDEYVRKNRIRLTGGNPKLN